MAGSALIVTMSNPYADMADPNKVTLDWTSDGSTGTVSIAICDTYATAQGEMTVYPSKLQGFLRSIETIPGLLGDKTTDVPTTLYDITLLDPYSYDISGNVLADRSASVAEMVIPTEPLYIDSEITLTISGAGNDKHGRIILELVPDALVR